MANREINTLKQTFNQAFNRSSMLRRIAISLSVGAFVGFLAPFGMHQAPLWISLTFWMSTCLLGYVIYSPTIALFDWFLQPWLARIWQRVAAGAFAASAVMSFVVPLMVWLFFGNPVIYSEQFLSVFSKTFLIGGVITLISFMRERSAQLKDELETVKDTHQTVANKAVEEFIATLPIDKRGELLCLEMADHYVKVYTDKGHHLLLMRFKDALTALDNYDGLQTHRSWWVARNAVVKVQKEQRKLQLVLSNDVIVPVSKTYVERVKQAGLS